MKLGTLKKICLQHLEQSDDVSITNTPIEELEEDDNFKEYLYNIEQSIYTAISRIVASKIVVSTTTLNGRKTEIGDMYRVIEVFAFDDSGDIKNVKYMVVGNTIFIQGFDSSYEYNCVYNPSFDSSNFISTEDRTVRNDLEIYGIPDDVLINVKYLVYADMKFDENPTYANLNRNYFENYIAEHKKLAIVRNQVELDGVDFNDSYGDYAEGTSIAELNVEIGDLHG